MLTVTTRRLVAIAVGVVGRQSPAPSTTRRVFSSSRTSHCSSRMQPEPERHLPPL